MRTKIFIIVIMVSAATSLFSQEQDFIFVGGHYGYGGPHVNQGFNHLTGIQLGYVGGISTSTSFGLKLNYSHFIPFRYGLGEGYQAFSNGFNENQNGTVTAKGNALMLGFGFDFSIPQSPLFFHGGLNIALQRLENQIFIRDVFSQSNRYMLNSIFHVNPELSFGYRKSVSDEISLDFRIGYTATVYSVAFSEMVGSSNGEFYRLNYSFAAFTMNYYL
ncbi:MAG: hypothetical protein JJU02_03895 [Cryomorphaceae bacterium]|nr:hypothetical protein [Cryomorphaceae bacterium]